MKRTDLSLVPKALLKSSQNLSCGQLAGLFLFLHFGNLNTEEYAQWMHRLQGPGFPLDLSSVIFWCMATGDRWKIKQLVGPMLMINGQKRRGSTDPSLVSIEVVKSNQCYKRVLQKMSPDGTKVLMEQPGEITFVPVKHCRWCGLIKVQKFRLCSLCDEHPEYCDLNYFCSEKCELEALDSVHREEHARFYMVKLGFDS
jgi:hypothetical protein